MRTTGILIAVCVAGWAPGALAEDAGKPSLEGRWTGQFGGSSGHSEGCAGAGGCKLTLDIVACGADWCGTRIDDNGGCAGAALRLTLTTKQSENVDVASFKGQMELVKGSSPYYVQAWSQRVGTDATPTLRMVGDSGGEIRVLRRTFPFSASLVRTDKAHCRADAKTS
jgi:hypothetical protein